MFKEGFGDPELPDLDDLRLGERMDAATGSLRDLAAGAWNEVAGDDVVADRVGRLRDLASDAWEGVSTAAADGAAVVADGAAVAAEGAKNTAYVAGRGVLGVGRYVEGAVDAAPVWVRSVLGDRDGAEQVLEDSVIDDAADRFTEVMDVSADVKRVGDQAEAVGEIAGAIVGDMAATVGVGAASAAGAVPAAVAVAGVAALGAGGAVLHEGYEGAGELTDGALAGSVAAAVVSGVALAGVAKAAKTAKVAKAAKEVDQVGTVGEAAKTVAVDSGRVGNGAKAVDVGADAATAAKAGLKDEVVDAPPKVVEAAGGAKWFKRDGVKHYLDDTGKVYRIGDDLKPKSTYEVNGYRYRTDGRGRVVRAEGQLRLAKTERAAIVDDMKTIAKGDALDGDQRGHIIAARFDGGNGMENIVAMGARVNQSRLKHIEDKCAKALESGAKVQYSVEPVYMGRSRRPSRIKVTDIIDGEKTVTILKNTAETARSI